MKIKRLKVKNQKMFASPAKQIEYYMIHEQILYWNNSNNIKINEKNRNKKSLNTYTFRSSL